MKTFLSFLASLLSLSAFGAGAPYLPVYNSARVAVPFTNSTNTFAGAFMASNPPPVATYGYPLIVNLTSNQSFVVQDVFGNNIFGARADAYNVHSGGEWEMLFGSRAFPLTDFQVNMGTSGADAGINMGGNAGSGFRWNSAAGHMQYQFLTTNATYITLGSSSFNIVTDAGTLYAFDMEGLGASAYQTVTVGAAAGTGASAVVDGNASDISVQITLTTGTSTLNGILFTYGQALLRTNIGEVVGLNKPVFCAANSHAAGAMMTNGLYLTSTTLGWSLNCNVRCTPSTNLVFNFFNCR